MRTGPRAAGDAISAVTDLPARALAEDGDVLRVAAEGRDVALHPLQRRDLVHQAVVADRLARPGGLGQRRVGEVAERAQPVVDGHHHHAVAGEVLAVIDPARAGPVAAAVDPDHHRRAPLAAFGA